MAEEVEQIPQKPFPHVVLKDLWPDNFLAGMYNEFPDEDDPRLLRFGNDKELKLQGDMSTWGPMTKQFYQALSSPAWIAKLEKMFGIPDLVADPTGGGYHIIPVGGYLGMHVDFNRFSNGLYRRLNCLVYMNPKWYQPGSGIEPEDGGFLHIGADADENQVRVAPEFNTTVIFETSDHSWHGHPIPTVHRIRRSFAVYYGQTDMPEAYDHEHSTVWLGGD